MLKLAHNQAGRQSTSPPPIGLTWQHTHLVTCGELAISSIRRPNDYVIIRRPVGMCLSYSDLFFATAAYLNTL